jgi:hypothetical protein
MEVSEVMIMAKEVSGVLSGTFREKDCHVYHTFVPSTNEWAKSLGFNHELDHHHKTPARICATRAYVVVDEDAEGKPVVEVWKIDQLITRN